MDKGKIIGLVIGAGIFIAILIGVLADCGGGSEEEETETTFSVATLEKKHATGVVFISTTMYYTIIMDNTPAFFFNGIDEEGDITGLTSDADELTPTGWTGTGFFVSNDGKIVTNRHVAADIPDETVVRAALRNYISQAEKESTDKINQMQLWRDECMANYRSSQDNDYLEMAQKYQDELESAQEASRNLQRLMAADIRIGYQASIFVGYQNTHINSVNDMHPATILAVDDKKDLALIQLNDKKTPENRHIFAIAEKDNITAETPLFLIGYTDGFILGQTETGLMPQIAEGKMVQDRGTEFTHNILSNHGSSGSPILNKSGRVVGVQYAQQNPQAGDSNFKFAIKASELNRFLSEHK